MLAFEFVQQRGHVLGCELAGSRASFSCQGTVDIDGSVERGQIDDAHAQGLAVAGGHFDDLAFGRLVFQRDFIPDQAHHLAGGGVSRREDRQPDLRSLGPANHLHHFGQAHVHDVHRGLVSLRHRNDAVAVEVFLALGRRPGQQP